MRKGLDQGGGVDDITLDIKRCLAGTGDRGLTPDMLEGLRPRLEAGLTAVKEAAGTGMLGWVELPWADPSPFLEFAAQRAGAYDALLVIGIGGSALGTIALANALLPFYHNQLTSEAREGRPRLYVLDNIDPEETASLLALLDLRRTLVNVVSKSGSTGESMAAYLIVKDRLEAEVGREGLRHHLVFTTDPEKGALRTIGRELGVPMFDLPSDVGGRFSVLSSVGLLPAAITGMDVPALLAGARHMGERISATQGWDNPALAFAGVHYLEDTVLGRRISVMMPYAARLRDFADWYRQLWAESLGKARDRHGRRVNYGPLPVRALGTTDQHSQLQLYMEGPDDKVFTFLGVSEFACDLPIPAPGPEGEALAYLGGHSLAELFWAEQRSTAWALAREGRPSLTITLPRVDAFWMGALFYLLEMATAVAGELYDVDAYDQPGVEAGKRATYALMGRPGYETLASEID